MNTHPSRPIGFRPTQPFGDNPRGVGWRFWIGPVLVSRVPGGVRVGWTR